MQLDDGDIGDETLFMKTREWLWKIDTPVLAYQYEYS